ncbi:unnamed protein product [Rhizoctonia solani]|uniref:Uncharacterized protein n=1 Tax=Rhizoctonia solani TaxID=456999 RepID=A0A8H3EB91_9AGAM|nr:unnamed protein product [Rhizoctonia solani]
MYKSPSLCGLFVKLIQYAYVRFYLKCQILLLVSCSTLSPSVLGKRTAPNEPVCDRVKRHKGINAVFDTETEKCSNTKISNAFKQKLRSTTYGHYVPRFERHYDGLRDFSRLFILFECIHGNPDHSPIPRGRLRSSGGTHGLIEAAKACKPFRLRWP